MIIASIVAKAVGALRHYGNPSSRRTAPLGLSVDKAALLAFYSPLRVMKIMGLPRILVVDDHVGVGEALALLFRHRKAGEVVGIVATAQEGLRFCQETPPDLIIVDLILAEGSGVSLLRQLRSSAPAIKTLIYSGCFKEAVILSALSQFPNGFVNKNAPMETVIRAIEAICTHGQMFFCPAISKFVTQTQGRCKALAQTLSERDQQVLELVVAGVPSKAIASQLRMSQRSVDTCRARIMANLGTPDIASLTRVAISAGLVPEDRIFHPYR